MSEELPARLPSKNPNPSKPRALSARQRKFIEIYDGRGIESARAAGYTGSDDVLGKTAYDLLRNPRVMPLIQAREAREIKRKVKTRQERQEFWTHAMDDESKSMSDRLAASQLLGRSEGDFVERIELDTISDLAETIRAARERAK